jgi:hypothetical protein
MWIMGRMLNFSSSEAAIVMVRCEDACELAHLYVSAVQNNYDSNIKKMNPKQAV